ncbi:hypothetical protein CYMTET_3541 [Cymbomonas tetramitiformis]|uniref:Uncharacterized protein n=1 Tax=Cymbomonas tetramitiformis TaxID=36881 RepID=A0AAE0H337_9CHLO|nr:hypothetical protein CYMTET_3541 [Cymbomonas tetramitiformis]
MGCGSSKSEGAAGGGGGGGGPAKPAIEATQAKLHSALRWQKVDEVKDIIAANNATVNEPDPANGNCGLHIASQNGHLELVKILVGAGANVNAQNGGGQSALHMTISYDLDDVTAFLKSNGADDSVVNGEGYPAKFGLNGEKDPNSGAAKVRALKAATTEQELLDSLTGLKGVTDVEKAFIIRNALEKKKEAKEAWTPAVQATFSEVLQSLP